MHYVFDLWMKRNYPENPWCRYADDGASRSKARSKMSIACFVKDDGRPIKIGLQEQVLNCLEMNESQWILQEAIEEKVA
jgi:hypothetical protein